MIKTRSFIMIVLGLMAVAAGMYLVKTVAAPQGVMKVLPYIFIGLGSGAFGHGLGEIFSQTSAKKHPEVAKQIEIDTKDERNVMIGNMAKAKGYDMMTYVFAALMLSYALMGAAFEVLIPFVIAYIFVQGYSIYQRFQIEKAQ